MALATRTKNEKKIGLVALKITGSVLDRERNRGEVFKDGRMLKMIGEFVKSIAAVGGATAGRRRPSEIAWNMGSPAWALLHLRQDYGCTVQNPGG